MTLTEIRQALEELETRPQQVLGQNFLHDQNLARWIVEQVATFHDGLVVEVGPGLGALTEYLLPQAERLVLLEKDALMVRWLGGRFLDPKVEIVHGDALDFDLRKLCGHGRVAVVGNLPYYVSTALIQKFTDPLGSASILVLTLQREVAQRLAAKSGDPDYGAMSVCVQRRWNVRFLRTLPPSVFYPAPKVASAVVSLTPREKDALRPLDEGAFERLVRAGFSERRKQLKNLLPSVKDRWLELCGQCSLNPEARAEDLSLTDWENLAFAIHPSTAQKDAELFDEVDENDRVIRPLPRGIIHVNNLRHRAVHMLLFNAAGELFLQKRSPWKDLNPSLWDSSAAGHVDSGEDYLQAAHRELREELDAETDLRFLGKIPCGPETSWEFVEVFAGSHEGPFQLAGMEVETGAFFPEAQIRDWFARRPGDFTPLFRLIFPRFLERWPTG